MTAVRRRFVGLVVLILLVSGAVLGAVLYADSSPPSVPEGGSAFGARPKERRHTDLLTALAPLLADDADPSTATAATTPATDQVTSAGSSSATPRKDVVKLRLPLARAAAQLLAVGFRGNRPSAPFFSRLRARDWGAVLLARGNLTDPAQLTAIAGEIGVVARNASHIAPLVVGMPGLPGVPRRRARTPGDARASALAAAKLLRPAGVSAVLGPSADVGYVGGPYAKTALATEPAQVGPRVAAAVSGWRSGGVAPIVGAFPGAGSASGNPDTQVATVGLSLAELRAADLKAFGAVRRTAPAIAMSNALYAAFDGVTPATLLPRAVRLLRNTGFRGVVISGDLQAVTLATGESVGDAAVAALNAGCDLLLLPGDQRDQEQAYRAIVRAVRAGDVSRARVNLALRRIAALKRLYRVT